MVENTVSPHSVKMLNLAISSHLTLQVILQEDYIKVCAWTWYSRDKMTRALALSLQCATNGFISAIPYKPGIHSVFKKGPIFFVYFAVITVI